MGDFNALEDSPAMAAFTHEAGFVDAFRSVHPTAAGFTCDQALYGPSPTVSQRIDYLLVLPGAEAPGKVCSSQVILHTPQQLADGRIVWPSDHYAVLAEVEVFLPLVAGDHSKPGAGDRKGGRRKAGGVTDLDSTGSYPEAFQHFSFLYVQI